MATMAEISSKILLRFLIPLILIGSVCGDDNPRNIEEAWRDYMISVIKNHQSNSVISETLNNATITSFYYSVRQEQEVKNKEKFFELSKVISTDYILPYRSLSESISYMWGDGYRQRGLPGLSLGATIKALNRMEEFSRRLEDKTDYFSNIMDYKDLLHIPGFSGRMYWKAERLCFTAEYEKAINVMSFFYLEENPDLFVRGAACYFLGRMYDITNLRKYDYEEAKSNTASIISYYLKVPAFPTCLTYISYSYLHASKLAARIGDYKTALALIMIKVPTVDRSWVDFRRFTKGYQYAYIIRDYTNCFRFMQGILRASPDYFTTNLYNGIPMDEKRKSDLWYSLATNDFTEIDVHNFVVDALTNVNEAIDYNLLYDALTIDWPKDNELPLEISTNRVLNNKYFKVDKDVKYEKYEQRKRQ